MVTQVSSVLEVGKVYYIPKLHRLIQVREIGGSKVVCGEPTEYFMDAKTTICSAHFSLSETTDWELVNDPRENPNLTCDHISWRVINDNVVNKEDVKKRLKEIADFFKQVPLVDNVSVFGSVAREGTGNDFDIIATVPDDIFWAWVASIKKDLEKMNLWSKTDFCAYFNSDLRMFHAENVLGISEIDVDDFLYFLTTYENVKGTKGYPIEYTWMNIDLFLFPTDWRERLPEMQAALPHKDPHFMEKIAKDVKLI